MDKTLPQLLVTLHVLDNFAATVNAEEIWRTYICLFSVYDDADIFS